MASLAFLCWMLMAFACVNVTGDSNKKAIIGGVVGDVGFLLVVLVFLLVVLVFLLVVLAADKINRGNEDEANLADKVEMQKKLKILDEKLSAALAEINAKDEIAKKQTNVAREAIQGWMKASKEYEKRITVLEGKLAETNKTVKDVVKRMKDDEKDEALLAFQKKNEALINFLSVVPSKKSNNGGGILKRLFRRRKKGSKK